MKSRRIYWTLIKMQIKTQMEYRKAFIILFISKLFGLASGLILIAVLLQKFKAIAGWSVDEIFFIYALDAFSYAFSGQFLMRPSMRLAGYIRSGEFDMTLTKPLNSFFYFIFREFSTGYFSNIIFCLVVLIVALGNLAVRMSVGNILFLIGTLVGGSLIQGAGFLFSTIPTFWMVKNDALKWFLLGELRDFIKYPLSIYHKGIQVLMTFVIPYAFINFIPAQYLLGKHDSILDFPVVPFLTPAVGIALFYCAYRFWFFGINRYRSTGS